MSAPNPHPAAALPAAKPPWLKVRAGGGAAYVRLRGLIRERRLHTVCEEALCPNQGRCWDRGRATLMILGDTCTRGCTFCGVRTGKTGVTDADEPRRAAEAVRLMGLRDVVLTSVTRDDLPDGGSGLWARTIEAVREAVPGLSVEALVPDFGGSSEALDTVLRSRPDVLAHNLETVERLYPEVRQGAGYRRSIELLRAAAGAGLTAKTGIMVGLGESDEEVAGVMRDALEAGCRIFTIGQYLSPTRQHRPVHRYVHPDAFVRFRDEGMRMGYPVVVAGPLVRSSYYSEEQDAYVRAINGQRQGRRT